MPDAKTSSIATIGAAIVLALGWAAGSLTVSTPDATQCSLDLARAQVRLELYREAGHLAKIALTDPDPLPVKE